MFAKAHLSSARSANKAPFFQGGTEGASDGLGEGALEHTAWVTRLRSDHKGWLKENHDTL